MFLNKKNLISILTIILLISIFVIYFSDSINKPYGNDKESIEKVIKSIEGYENESIEILVIKDINDDRLVGFLTNNNPAYIHFSKNKKGDYEWRHIEKREGQSFVTYLIHVSDNGSSILKFMIVTNDKNEIAKMELGVNEQIIEQEFRVNKKSVTWIDIPESNGKTNTYNYKYYDRDGNLIGD